MKKKKKTKEYIKIKLIDGTEQKRTIYVDDNGLKYIYNQRRYWKLEDFIKTHRTV